MATLFKERTLSSGEHGSTGEALFGHAPLEHVMCIAALHERCTM